MDTGPAGPLAGLRVVELSALGPVPFCGMLLGDMGADVVRIDRTVAADLGIGVEPRFDLRGRNKRSAMIDVRRPAGRDAVLALVDRADVLLEGFRPGVAERLGIGPDACLARRPSLVYGRGTGWGQDGPRAHTAGHDINYIALTGALDMIGPADGPPVPPLNLIGDYGGGALYLAFGVLCAVLDARATGRGQIVDAAMVDGVASLLTVFHAFRQAGTFETARGGNALGGAAPYYRAYETSDGRFMAVGAIEPRFFALLLDRLDLDPAALPAQEDRAGWPLLVDRIGARFRTRTRAEWTAHFADSDACCSPILSIDEAPGDPHNLARATFAEVEGIAHPAPAPRLSATPGAIRRAPPPAGADTISILSDWGIDEALIRAGLRDGVFRQVAG